MSDEYVEHGEMPTILDESPLEAVVEQEQDSTSTGTNPEDFDIPDNSAIFDRLEADLRSLDEEVRRIAGVQPSAQQQGPRDYRAELTRLAEMIDDGDISIAEAVERQSEILGRLQEESADRIRQEVYTQKEADKILNDFHKAHPDFQQFAASKDMQRILASNPMHDQFSAYWQWKSENPAGSTRTGTGTKALKGIETRGMDIRAVIANRLANTRRAGK